MSADHTKFQSPDDKPMPHSHSSNLDQQNVGSNSASQEQQQPLLFSYVELQNAEQMYREGKIAQEREQWNEAAELFSKSLEIRTKHYGLDYPGLAEHYHRYGRVLIEVAKQEGDPFGDAIKSKIKEQQQKQQQQQQQQQIADQRGHIESFDDGVKENTSQIVDINQSTSRSKESKDSREETKVPKEEIKFEEKNNNLTQKIEQKPTEVVDITSVVKIEDVNEENPLYPMASSETEKKSEESESAEEEDTTDEENNAHNENTEGEEQGEGEDNLEIAWEALEAARVLYVRQEEYLKLSDVHIDLGTVALESGNITAAIEEYEKSLKLRQQHLPNTDRRIAEAHFQMGLAYSLLPNNEKAREHYTAARDILQENVIILKKLSSHTNEHSIHNNSNQKTAENVIVPSVTFASSETSYVSKIGDSTEDEIQKKREEALKEMEEAIIELNDRIEEVSLPLLQQPNSTVSVPLPPGYDQFAQR
jgi:nuclear autoantigenic sperm protein